MNDRKLRSQLDRLNRRMTDRQLQSDRLLKGAKPIEDHIKRNTPVLTGALRDDTRSEKEGGGAVVYNTKEYAPKIEFTTKPFMREGFMAGKNDSVLIIAKEYKKEL